MTGGLTNPNTELLDLSTWSWKQSTPYPTIDSIYSTATLYHEGLFYVFGGKTQDNEIRNIMTFDVLTETWSVAGNMASIRYG